MAHSWRGALHRVGRENLVIFATLLGHDRSLNGLNDMNQGINWTGYRNQHSHAARPDQFNDQPRSKALSAASSANPRK